MATQDIQAPPAPPALAPLPVYTFLSEAMSETGFDAAVGLAVLGDLARLTAAPAGRREICDQGLALTAKALGASRALLLLSLAPDSPPEVVAVWGEGCGPDMEDLGRQAFLFRGPFFVGLLRVSIDAILQHADHLELGHQAIELRAEIFNLLDTPPFGAPAAVLGAANVGTITSAGDPRVVQLALKIVF